MDPTVAQVIAATLAQTSALSSQHHQERLGRQSDASQMDNRGFNAAVFKAITETDMGEIIANLNTGSHAPTPQPFVAPGWIYNPSSQPK